ncbi:MAG: FKBP-type peptidyl-prolyl cis-trans isomerase [Gemmatimonadota bacterium]
MSARSWRRAGRWSKTVAFAVFAGALAACGDEPTPFEVVDEITFDASLGVDLADFTELPSGIWIQDETVGMGDPVLVGSTLTITYTGWLRSGVEFDAGSLSFVYPGGHVPGFTLGFEGMAEGGVRRVIIPPGLAYGDSPPGPPIYGGAVLIFRLAVTVVN